MLELMMFLSLFSQLFSTVHSRHVPLYIKVSSYCLAKDQPTKMIKTVPLENGSCCGEDDFVVASKDSTTLFGTHPFSNLIGVADGVGGWNQQGVNPKIFTSALLTFVKSQFMASPKNSITKLVTDAFALLRSKKPNIRNGSCTLCLVSFDTSNGTCSTYNLGDSGYCIYRNGEIVHKSSEQQRYFNAPYQIGLSNGVPADMPDKGNERVHKVEPDDIIVVATDGMFDNLFPEEIEAVIRKAQENTLKQEEHLGQRIARELVVAAKQIGNSKTAKSPFAVNAASAGYYFLGGKNDDTTVVVGVVQAGDRQVCDTCAKEEL